MTIYNYLGAMTGIIISKCPVCGNQQLEKYITVRDHSISGEEFELFKCSVCQLLVTQPQPDEKSIGRYYSSDEYISHSDTDEGIINKVYHQVRAVMLRQKHDLVCEYQQPGRLLDIGCGTGYFPAYMRENGWEVTGLEPDESARQVALRKLELEIQDINRLPELPESTFDVITMWHVLEHVHKLGETISTVRKLLKPTGTFICAVPNYTSADARKYGAYWAAYDVPRHLWHFAPATMTRLLGDRGLHLVKTRGMPFDAYYVSLLSEKYRGNKAGIFAGAIYGTASNFQAMGSPDKSSSVIYISKPV